MTHATTKCKSRVSVFEEKVLSVESLLTTCRDTVSTNKIVLIKFCHFNSSTFFVWHLIIYYSTFPREAKGSKPFPKLPEFRCGLQHSTTGNNATHNYVLAEDMVVKETSYISFLVQSFLHASTLIVVAWMIENREKSKNLLLQYSSAPQYRPKTMSM